MMMNCGLGIEENEEEKVYMYDGGEEEGKEEYKKEKEDDNETKVENKMPKNVVDNFCERKKIKPYKQKRKQKPTSEIF